MPNVPATVKVALFNTMRFDEDYRPSTAITTTDNSKAYTRPAGAISSDNQAMREAFGKVIYNTQADIIGFNEIEETMNEYSDENSVQKLAEAQGCNYTYKFFSSSAAGWWEQILGGTGKLSFANGFAYNADVLTLNDSGRAWYNDSNSNNYSTSSDSGSGDPNRTYVWAKFTHKESGKEFYFFVTQLPTSASGNTKAANGINNFAQSKAGSAPQILVGDMNNADKDTHECYEGSQKLMTYWTDAYNALDEAGNLGSFYKTYCGTQSGTGKTYQYSILDFCKNHPERRIDRIFTKGGCTATTYKTIRTTYTFEPELDTDIETYYPSDHLAVVCDVTLD
jgi:endonuclease/exonuclease/phosphatase family metal-dependent hydrolase